MCPGWRHLKHMPSGGRRGAVLGGVVSGLGCLCGGGGRRGATYEGLGAGAVGRYTLCGIQTRCFTVAPEDEPTSRERFCAPLYLNWDVSKVIVWFTMVAKSGKTCSARASWRSELSPSRNFSCLLASSGRSLPA